MADDYEKKTKLGLEVMRVSEIMEDLQNENMTEEKFWGLMALNDEEGFDYGRDTLKDVVYEQRW